ncbi:unnamed protein product [Prunus armeniaca]
MLSKEFDVKDLGATQKILSMEIQRDRTAGRIWISQAKYIQKLHGKSRKATLGCSQVDFALFEKQKENAGVLGYVDADYAGDLDKRRSTSGYVFTCVGGPISWRALLQPITALLTTEAEYIALAEVGKEAIWLSGWHIEARYHRIRNWVESKEIWIEKIHTDDNATDFLTKIMPAKKFKHCLNLINLVD